MQPLRPSGKGDFPADGEVVRKEVSFHPPEAGELPKRVKRGDPAKSLDKIDRHSDLFPVALNEVADFVRKNGGNLTMSVPALFMKNKAAAGEAFKLVGRMLLTLFGRKDG